ncbi:MAG TPA: phosphoenolpyruvate carboxykinase, partial [Candidatus Binatia bacterium]|nr:phosphoenolpyruvate carboxykinase [Candidatus Binatia bacterium]
MSNSTGRAPANPHIQKWVKDMAAMCQPDNVFWCDGSESEREQLTEVAVEIGDLMPLNQNKLPGSYLHRSALNDVARTENLTFVCTPTEEEAGPNNNWMAPAESYERLAKIFTGAMRGRTMYVIPFLMGPEGSAFSKVGVQLTDSVYVVLNMRIMTRMGKVALDHLGGSNDF